MSAALADLTGPKPTRRVRAGNTIDKSLRWGVLAAAAAAVAWLLAVALSGMVFFALIVATVIALLYTVVSGDKARMGVWGIIAVAWALVLAERWVVHENGGFVIAVASYVGVVLGARRAGLAKKSYVLLGYPLISVAIIVAAGQNVLHPWGMSWLWVPAILGPVIAARTLVKPSPRASASA